MQRFVNNWSATLDAPLLAAETEMQVPAALAAKLLLDEGDYYDLTLDPHGEAPEIVRITAVALGALTISSRGREGTVAPASWPAGTVVRCCATAEFMQQLQTQAGGLEDAPQDGEIYGRVDGEWDVIPYPTLSGRVLSVDSWWNWTKGVGVTGTLRNSYLDFDLPEESQLSRKYLLVYEIDATIPAQPAGPADFAIGYTPSGFSGWITPAPVVVYDAEGDWEIGLLYQDGITVRVATRTLDLTDGGSVRHAACVPYPARADLPPEIN